MLTGRLAKVLHSVVSPCQTCGIPGRFSGEVVRLVQDSLDFANSSNLGGALTSLDQEKAFDRIDWVFLQKVLTAMNFGSSFRAWILLLYNTLYSRVLINGTLEGPFFLFLVEYGRVAPFRPSCTLWQRNRSRVPQRNRRRSTASPYHLENVSRSSNTRMTPLALQCLIPVSLLYLIDSTDMSTPRVPN